MPRDPKRRKRPADVIGNAIMVAKIATGEIPTDALPPDDGKDLRRRSEPRAGKARAKSVSAEKRAAIARKAAERKKR